VTRAAISDASVVNADRVQRKTMRTDGMSGSAPVAETAGTAAPIPEVADPTAPALETVSLAAPVLEAAGLAAPVLEAAGLAAARGPRRVLENISLTLRAGEWTAIVGPNGAGKSTLLGLLAGLLRPAAGSIRLYGRPLQAWNLRARACQLAWLAQHGEAEGEIPVRDVVRIGRLPRHGLFGAITVEDENAVDSALAEMECSALAERRLDELSGGERQRVLLARALAVEAPILLLDEPTTHLDAPHQRTLIRSLRQRVRAGATAVTVLHDLTLALAADRLLVLADGCIQADGPPADPTVRRQLTKVFGDAFRIAGVDDGHELRWVVLPAL